MKFLLVVLVIRYVFVLLGKMTTDELDERDERKNFIHPSEFKIR